jgi:hypothetical protein
VPEVPGTSGSQGTAIASAEVTISDAGRGRQNDININRRIQAVPEVPGISGSQGTPTASAEAVPEVPGTSGSQGTPIASAEAVPEVPGTSGSQGTPIASAEAVLEVPGTSGSQGTAIASADAEGGVFTSTATVSSQVPTETTPEMFLHFIFSSEMQLRGQISFKCGLYGDKPDTSVSTDKGGIHPSRRWRCSY